MYIHIYIYICTYIHKYTYICIYVHTPAVVHEHAQSSSCDALGRGTLATYALESAEADCLPTDADRLAYPPADAPLFALDLTAALRDAGAP